MNSHDPLQSLPPLARAQAMDRPYRPGRSALLIGLLLILAVYALVAAWYLLLRKPPKVTMTLPPTPGIVYQNVRAPISPPPRAAEGEPPPSP